MSDQSSQRSSPLMSDELADDVTVRRPQPSGDEANKEEKLESDETIISKGNSLLPPPPSAEASPAEIAKVLEGAELGHFRLDRLIGGGGMGAVFRAADTRLDRTVAVKVIPRVGEDLDLLRRFRNEAQSAAKLDHPNIARVYDVGQENGWHFIVFEYIDGINLRDLVSREGVLSIKDAINYIRQVAEALEHANERGVVHRDIKPSNVLVTTDGHIKLVDMGLARSQQVDVTDDMTASGVTLGTFDYISPEQAKDPRAADVRSDLYSLGCTFYYVLVGRPPFPGGSIVQKLMNHGNAPPPNPQVFRSEISSNLTAIIHKLLAKNPSDRYPRPHFLVADLHRLSKDMGLSFRGSLGTSHPASSIHPGIRQHLPWIVVSILFVLSIVWLEIVAAPHSTLNIPDREAITKTDAPQEPAGLNSVPSSQTPPEPTQGTTAISSNEPNENPESLTTITVDPDFEGYPDTAIPVQTVTSLEAAFAIASTDLTIDTIELTGEYLQCGNLVVPRSGLTVKPVKGISTVIEFTNDDILTMERPQKIRLGGHRISLSDIHISWSVPPDALDGGTLFGLTGLASEKISMSNCSITIENSSRRNEVYAFEVNHGNGEETAEDHNDSLVWFDWTNCIFRGQMSLIGMDVASRLEVRWENGLLVCDELFLQTGGALTQTGSEPDITITFDLEKVTTYCGEGFAQIRLGPSSSFPVRLDRTCNLCVLASNQDSHHIEVSGLYDLPALAPKCLSLQGANNAYDPAENEMGILYRASNMDGDALEFGWLNLADPDQWFENFGEGPRKSSVRWSDVTPPDKPFHLQVPSEYEQEGVGTAGFELARIPVIPEKTKLQEFETDI